MKTKQILIILPIIFFLFLAVNFVFVSSKARPGENQLIIGSIGDASFLNPILAQDSSSGSVNGFIFNGLLKYNEELQLTGDLAKSWTVIESPQPQITFALRKDIKWHDGHPFTSHDVLFTYKKIMDKKTNTVRRSDFELVKSVIAIDPYTVQINYKEPFSPALDTWTIGIIPEHILKGENINTALFNRSPIGTGPFKFDLWVSDEKIVLVANDDYFEGKPNLDRIVFRIIPETSLTEIELLTGGIDYSSIFPHQYKRMKQHTQLKLYREPSLGYTYIGYNIENPLFRDKLVRQALTCAIDREKILKYVLYNLGQIATGPFPNHMWYADSGVRPFPYDPEMAKGLLRKAGWLDTDGDGIIDKDGKPFSFHLITNSGNETRSDVGVLVQRYFREIGIDVDFQIYEWSVFLKNFINSRHFDACILGWSLSVDPDAYNIWHSSQIKDGFNFIGYKNQEVDRLLVEGRRAYDIERRKLIYNKIHQLINEDQPYTFLFVADSIPALSTKFKRLKKSSGGKPTFYPIEMTKGGLLFNIHEWAIPRYTSMSTYP
ncbi:MAG: peptide-binding protein [Pseudomonadota bacterium]